MANKLYVGNLAYKTTERDLQAHFEAIGPCNAKLIIDKNTNRSRGFGFVEYDTAHLADEAISRFNGQPLDGRQLVVNPAREEEPRGGGRQRRG